jgi:hypothetical protein
MMGLMTLMLCMTTWHPSGKEETNVNVDGYKIYIFFIFPLLAMVLINSLGIFLPTVAPASLGALIRQSGTGLYALSLFYTLTFIYAVRRTCTVRYARSAGASGAGSLNAGNPGSMGRAPGFFSSLLSSPPQLFAASVVFAALLRASSFITCTALALGGSSGAGSGGGDGAGAGAPKSEIILQILFNAGDWATLNCFSLLLLVWLELLLRARASVWAVPSRQIARDWRRALMVIAVAVQLVQAGLYAAALTVPQPTASRVLVSIYAAIAAFNFALAGLAIVGSSLAFFLYAGLPFRSDRAAAASGRVWWLVAGWTVGRLSWGVASLFCEDDGFAAAVARVGEWFFSVVAVTFFAVAELLPFLLALGTESLAALGWEGGSGGGGGGAAAPGRADALLAPFSAADDGDIASEASDHLLALPEAAQGVGGPAAALSPPSSSPRYWGSGALGVVSEEADEPF